MAEEGGRGQFLGVTCAAWLRITDCCPCSCPCRCWCCGVQQMVSEQPERFFVSEIIREKIFLRYSDEIPYASQVRPPPPTYTHPPTHPPAPSI